MGLAVESSTQSAGRTYVVLTFSSGTDAFGSLIDGNYEFVVNGGVLGIDADGSGTAGGTSTTRFHRLFGDSDGDRDVDGRDYYNYILSLRGNALLRRLFDQDDDTNLIEERADFFARYGRRLNP